MLNLEMHEMRLERTYPSSAEEWYCPSCERRFLMYWQPKIERVILQPGNELAMHTGGKDSAYPVAVKGQAA